MAAHTPERIEALNDHAARCRRLAGVTHDRELSEMLDKMAEQYARAAAELSRKRTA